MTFGILGVGAYVPRLRLARTVIAAANNWFTGATAAHAQGERAMCNWDEDAVTMAVAAARDALTGQNRGEVQALRIASTTLPFADRLNAGIVAEALALPPHISLMDVTGTQRAGTSALYALHRAERTLLVATEHRRARAASQLESTSGDGAAALLLGRGEPLARLTGSASFNADFVDHYRSAGSPFDYAWEERWVRDAGYLSLVPDVIARCLWEAGVQAEDVAHFCMPAPVPRAANAVAKAAGIPPRAIRDDLHAVCGDTGTAHSILMLVHALEQSQPGERILVVGFGQGADALLFEVTDLVRSRPAALGVSGHLARRREESSYGRFLAFNDLIELERGMRAETDKLTPLSALWRNRAAVTAFVGGRCTSCGTAQFPASRICVEPSCNAVDTQEPHAFADQLGRVSSYTADRLTYSPDPPACFGMVQFDAGGRAMLDFTDVEPDALEVGQVMSMVFRIKDVDAQRGFRRYFWKAAPAVPDREEERTCPAASATK
jgi:3-hydroxy-3-methylglutaryl CoA synthase